MMIKPLDYKQTDSQWKSIKYAVDGESSTIGSAGCGPTACADVIGAIISNYVDPLTTASWARMKNYKVKNSGTSYSFPTAIGKAYGVKITRLNNSSIYGSPKSAYHTTALDALKHGDWLIACMGKGNWTSSGHYIVAYGYKDGMVYINDPGSTKASRACNTWSLFASQVKFYWVVTVPDKIKQSGKIAGYDSYNHTDFVREVQMVLGAGIDGKAGAQTLSKTITVSKSKNSKKPVVRLLQKKLKSLSCYTGAIDCVAGPKFDEAAKTFQRSRVGLSKPDGEFTAQGKSWKEILSK